MYRRPGIALTAEEYVEDKLFIEQMTETTKSGGETLSEPHLETV